MSGCAMIIVRERSIVMKRTDQWILSHFNPLCRHLFRELLGRTRLFEFVLGKKSRRIFRIFLRILLLRDSKI